MAQLITKSAHLYESSAPVGNKTTLLANARVRVGGEDPAWFVPNVNASKWGDRVWLNMRSLDFEPVKDDATLADQVTVTKDGVMQRWFIDADDRVQHDIIFAAKPRLELKFQLSYPDGLRFALQPALSAEEAAKYPRPDNVEGSYAVYWRESNNEFQTGKFCHLFYPFLVDAHGARVRAEQFVFDEPTKTLLLVLPGKWLDEAAYPVLLDPDMGYASSGASYTGDRYSIYASHDTPASAGTCGNAHAYVYNSGTSGVTCKLCVYTDDTGNNRPQAQLAAEVQCSIAASYDGEVSGAYTPDITLAKHWLGYTGSANAANVRYDADVANRGISYDLGSYDLPNPWPDAGTNSTARYSVWVDYSVGDIAISVAETFAMSESLD